MTGLVHYEAVVTHLDRQPSATEDSQSMSTNDSSNPMRDQVLSLPALIREQVPVLETRTRKILSTPEMFGVRQIVLAGCGDSYIAGKAAETAFIELARIPTEALNAMQAARYHAGLMGSSYPHNPLVLAVSVSGEVARVVEATKNYTQAGALTVAVTGSLDSRLAQQAQRLIEVSLPPFRSAPGVRSFITNLIALYLLAIRLGEVRGNYTMDEASALRKELRDAADLIEGAITSLDTPLENLSLRWKELELFEVLGSGPDRGTAAYGVAKLIEAAGVYALHEDIEEWVHLHYFVRAATHTGTIVICPENAASYSRVAEIEPLLRNLGRPYVILTGEAWQSRFSETLTVSGTIRPIFAPLVYSVLLALFAAHLTPQLRETYHRGATGQWADCKNGSTTRKSMII